MIRYNFFYSIFNLGILKMKIYHDEASSLVSAIIHSNQSKFRRLSLKDRKICLKAMECLSKVDNHGIHISLQNGDSYNKFVAKIKNILDTIQTVNPSSLTKRIVHNIQSLAKRIFEGFIDLFALNISSTKIYRNIQKVKLVYFNKYWDQYLKDYCDVKANCDLNKAKIFLLGDHHTDPIQKMIRNNIIAQYAHEGNKEDNLILLEGISPHLFIQNLDGKEWVRESWEKSEDYSEHLKIVNQIAKCLKDRKEELNKVKKERDEILKIKNANEQKNKILELIKKLSSMEYENKLDFLNKEDDRLKKVRDKNLFDNIKINALKNYKKIFVIAGSDHLLKNSHLHFDDMYCATIIPKVSGIGKENNEIAVEHMLKKGTYSFGHVHKN